MLLAVAACGGGGGTAGTPVTGGGGNGVPTAAVNVGVTLSSSTVTSVSPATVTVTVKNKAGAGLPGVVVGFSTTLGMGSFSAPSALTDANGVATVQVAPNTTSATGADTVVAKVKVNDVEYSGSTGFQMTATNVTIGSFTSDVSTLAAYGQTSLTVQLAGITAGSPVNVAATSSCVVNGKATLTPANLTTTTGRAVFTYRDNGCGAVAASDALQVVVTGTSLTASLNIGLTSPAVSSISFVSASPETIYLKGSGYVENSNVKFKVVDANGNGVPERLVELEPTTLAGGLLVDGGSGKVTKKTDSNGEVIVRVNSGTVPTPVRVKATLSSSTISTVSSSLAIAVGLPSQLNFSLSAQTLNIEGYNRDGTTNIFNVIASDRMGNPVPNGTAINFVTESGQVEATRQTTMVNGISRTSANYVSSNPRPLDGRVTLLAYALGEKSFLDSNGDNVYTAGEPYQDLGDAFVDRLLNFDPGTQTGFNVVEDQFISLGFTGSLACKLSSSSLLDLDRSMPSRPGTCTQSFGDGKAYVRRAMQTILSTSEASPVWGTSAPNDSLVKAVGSCPGVRDLLISYEPSDKPVKLPFINVHGTQLITSARRGSVSIVLSDANPVAFNPMAAGTTLEVEGTAGLSVRVVAGSPIPSTDQPSAGSVIYEFDPITSQGSIFFKLKSPSGLQSGATVSLRLESDAAAYQSASPTTCP
ncbi:Ig-like domain-containing protein [Inhella proteolytica]|uniref:Ig-like domain-containing protein n=1 Tax=Inhella proteolytica TaxID=2795029 RepID=A0A931J1L8_9BURK|nr:Ig-like domain-containing protein [Inhella proteolytica]MBH9576013.1 Ig-like domain-containing protein [Inhella proteolytica]